MEGGRSSGILRSQLSDLPLSRSAALCNTAGQDPRAPPGFMLDSKPLPRPALAIAAAVSTPCLRKRRHANVLLLISCTRDDGLLGTRARIQSVMIFNSGQPAAVCCLQVSEWVRAAEVQGSAEVRVSHPPPPAPLPICGPGSQVQPEGLWWWWWWDGRSGRHVHLGLCAHRGQLTGLMASAQLKHMAHFFISKESGW